MSQEPINKANKKVRIDVSFEEYKKAIKTSLKKDYHIENEYIEKLDESIKESYEIGVEVSQILGTDQVSPSGYCFAANLMYPDIL